MAMTIKRFLAYLVLVAMIGLSLAIMLGNRSPWLHVTWTHKEFHSTIEALGGVIAVAMAFILIQRSRDKESGKQFQLAAGLLTMGLLDGFHAAASPGSGFVILHSVAGLAGGFSFALVWLPLEKKNISENLWILWLMAAGSILVGILTLSFPQHVPLMLQNGKFTNTALLINFLAAVLFFLAASRFILDFHLTDNTEDYLFVCLALLFGLAALTFTRSVIWQGVWWIWHMLRLFAYFLALGFTVHGYRRMVSDLRISIAKHQKIEKELRRKREHLEELVRQRTQKLVKANDQLQQSRNFLQVVIDAAPELTLVINRDFSIELANQAARDMAGKDPVSIGLKCHQLTHHRDIPCDGRDDPCPLESVISTRMPVKVVHTHFDAAGDKTWVEITAAPIFDEAGDVIQVVEACRDITELKIAGEALKEYSEHLEDMVEKRTKELREAQEHLIRQERLSILGRLMAIVSHDLRNPLGVIRSSAFYLENKLKGDDEKVTKHLRRINEQVRLCNSIVGELLEYTRGSRSKMSEGEINQLIEEVLDEMEVPGGVNLVRELTPDLPKVSFDKEKLRRGVINLVANAIQAVIERYETRYEEYDPYQPQIKLSTSKVENSVCIEVEDNGIGMNDETAGRALEPLFTTKARGTGLGLAIVQKIVEEHGGNITLDSKPGRGTKAVMIIPIEQ